jgi:hypothetical protein
LVQEFPAPVWNQWISPETLLEQVRSTAPFLFSAQQAPETLPDSQRFLRILARQPDASSSRDDQLLAYFEFCLACHHATVATFVPTDVDSKIRGILWKEAKSPDLLRRMSALALEMGSWDLSHVSRRWDCMNDLRPISGHNGEWLSVLAGALGRMSTLGMKEEADQAAAAIDDELNREALAFRIALHSPGAELLTLRLAMSITHNLGDLDQGISFWDSQARLLPYREKFSRLAHENRLAYQGTFSIAAAIYREALATEGHRHYPLRAVKPLRRSADLLLPLSPFLDSWGALTVTHPQLTESDRSEVLEALAQGCRKVPNQQGYFRAIAGIQEAGEGQFQRLTSHCANSTQKLLRDPKLRQRIAVPRVSFESALKKRIQQARRAGAPQ